MWRYMKPARSGMCVPQTSTRGRAPGVEAMHELGGRVDVLGLAAVVAVAGDLVGEVPGHDAGVQPRLQDVQAHAADRAALLHGRARRPRARARRPGRRPARRGSPRRRGGRAAPRPAGAGCAWRWRRWPSAARRSRPRRRRCSASPRPGASSCSDAPRSFSGSPLSSSRPPLPAQLAQADARREGRLAGDLEAQLRRASGGRAPTGAGARCARGRGRWRGRRGRDGPAGSAARRRPASRAPRSSAGRRGW